MIVSDAAAHKVLSWADHMTEILPVNDGRSAPEGSWAGIPILGGRFKLFSGPVLVQGLAFFSSDVDS